jgi:hypothetical protein
MRARKPRNFITAWSSNGARDAGEAPRSKPRKVNPVVTRLTRGLWPRRLNGRGIAAGHSKRSSRRQLCSSENVRNENLWLYGADHLGIAR